MFEPSLIDALGTVTAAGALGAWREARKIRHKTERNNKLLEGIEGSQAYDGVVSQVQRHEEALESENIL